MKIVESIIDYGQNDRNVVLILTVGSSIKYENVSSDNMDIIIVYDQLKLNSFEKQLDDLSSLLVEQEFEIADILSDVLQFKHKKTGYLISVCPITKVDFTDEIDRLVSGKEKYILGSIVPWTIAGRFFETYLEDLSLGRVLYDPNHFFTIIKNKITSVPILFKNTLIRELLKLIEQRTQMIKKAKYKLFSKLAINECSIAYIRLVCLENNVYFPGIKYIQNIKDRIPSEKWEKIEICLADKADYNFFRNELEDA